MFEEMKQTWRAFKRANPGERFAGYRERLRKQDGRGRAARITVGVLLTAAGVAMLVLPGPGVLGILFGVALIAGESRRVANAFDRLERWGRRMGNRAQHRWRVLGVPARVVVVTLAAALAGAGTWLMWQWTFA